MEQNPRVILRKQELAEVLKNFKDIATENLPETYTINQSYLSADESRFYEFVGEAKPLTNSELVNLLVTHVSIINSERAAIWSRFTMMVIANTLALNLFSGTLDAKSAKIYFGTAFGFLLCVAWALLTVLGWSHYLDRIETASKFVFLLESRKINPIRRGTSKRRRRDVMRWVALSVVFLFALAYIFLLWHHMTIYNISIKQALTIIVSALTF